MAVSDVKKIYQDVIADVCSAVREALSEEGYDDHTLQELRTLWLARLENSRALEPGQTSIVDQATNRNFRHSNTGETNNKQGTEAKIARFHQASNAPISTYNPTYVQPTTLNAGIVPTTSATTTQFIRPNFPNAGKTSNQLDGTNDEMIFNPNEIKKKKKNCHKKKSHQIEISLQLDGTGPPLGDDDEDDDDNNSEAEGNDVADDLDDEDDEEGNEEGREDPNPLCSDDDVSDDEPSELFDTDNVVVCQYDKISRTKNKWRFILKSGVMNIDGRDYVFSKATGDADW